MLDLHCRVRQAFSAYGLGGDYGCARLVLLVTGLLLVEIQRLGPLRYVPQNALLAWLCELAPIPSQRTVVHWLKEFAQDSLYALIALNSEPVSEQVERLDLPRLTLDEDGTVIRTGAR